MSVTTTYQDSKKYEGGREMEIKDIVQPKNGYFKVKYMDLEANIFEDGRQFCAVSFDEEWCCVGVIPDAFKEIDNKNPVLQVNEIFKNVKG